MCNIESTHRSRLPDPLSPQFDLMSSSYRDRSSSLRDLGTLFVATIMDAKDFMDQLEATFCEEFWPAFCGEFENSRRRITELEKYIDASNKEREERQQLESEREAERIRLRTQLVKKGTRVETEELVFEKQILQRKLQTLLEQNLNVEKQRQNLADEVEQLKVAAKHATTKEVFLMAENHKFAKMRSQLDKSEVLHNRLSLRSQKKLSKDGSPSSLTAGKDVEPFISEDPQNLKARPLVRSACSLQDQPVSQAANQNIVHGKDASDMGKKGQMPERSLEMEADGVVDRAVVAVPLESPPPAEAMCQGEPAKESDAVDAQNIVCPQRPKAEAKCDAESRPFPPAGFVDSDETVMDVVEEDPISGGIFQKYPLVSISSETEVEPCEEPLQLPSGRVIGVIPRGAVEQKKMEDERGPVQNAGPLMSISPNLQNLRQPSGTKTGNKPEMGPKEQSWRQTRHRAEPSDRDPHDSFLDTPRERVLAQHAAAKREECLAAQFLAVPLDTRAPATNELDDGSIEARDRDKGAQDHPSTSARVVVETSNASRPDRRGTKAPASKAPPFKFNEPVRKKRDREALKGTDCKQCKKFYDAVAAGNANGMLASHCEHQNAVSRHRFKYLPPPTPEGFWNIGFDDSVNSPDHAE